ncbi:hypothetical protein [Clostridium cavendishii]|nr:hypothetical protein [Clostridium cavendishii]
MDFNEIRAFELIQKYGLQPQKIDRDDIRRLLLEEIQNYQEGSSEYIRVLCGMLFCIGDSEDSNLIKDAKYGINMDVGCMVDVEWIHSLNGEINEYTRDREDIIKSFVEYYTNYFSEYI